MVKNRLLGSSDGPTFQYRAYQLEVVELKSPLLIKGLVASSMVRGLNHRAIDKEFVTFRYGESATMIRSSVPSKETAALNFPD